MAFTATFCFLVCSSFVSGIPMQVTINQRSTECIYDKLELDESVTMSVFILSGAELRGTAILEGPIAPPEANTGKELQDSLDEFQKGKKFGKLTVINENVDFEHLQPQVPDDDGRMDDDDDGDTRPLTGDERRKRNEKRREKAREMRKQQEKKRLEREKVIRDEGQPVQKTVQAKAAGWYRLCVRATWYQVSGSQEMKLNYIYVSFLICRASFDSS